METKNIECSLSFTDIKVNPNMTTSTSEKPGNMKTVNIKKLL